MNRTPAVRIASRAKDLRTKLALSAAMSLLLAGPFAPHAFSQVPAAPPAAREDEAMTRARQAYDALPAADRRAIQDNLVWTGIYKGIVDGEFGRMTYNAMRTYTSRRPGAVEGILGAPDRAALAAEAAKARAAVDFRVIQEPRAGFAIGIPQKIFSRKTDGDSGVRFETADKTAGVETFRLRESTTSLQTFYESLRATAPNRRVTYSVLRPDFFVVAAETPTRSSYTRVARGMAGNEAVLRGFTVSWPKAQQARYEILSIAIANAFDPFGHKAAAAAGGTKPSGAPGADASQRTAPPSAPAITSTAVALAPNRFVAVLSQPVCMDARVGSRAARLVRQDPATGLTLFEVAGATATRLRAGAQKAASGASAVVLFAAPGERPTASSISVATGSLSDFSDPQTARLLAYLPSEATGAPVLSRKGELVGLVAPVPANLRKNPGAPPPASRTMISGEALMAFAMASGLELLPPTPSETEFSSGRLAADIRGSVEALWCTPPATPR